MGKQKINCFTPRTHCRIWKSIFLNLIHYSHYTFHYIFNINDSKYYQDDVNELGNLQHLQQRNEELAQQLDQLRARLENQLLPADAIPEDGENAVAAIGRQKIPPFWRENTTLCFSQIEIAFNILRITRDATKFKYVILQLDQATLPFVSDIIANPPREEKYQTIKDRINGNYSESDESKLRRLLRGSRFTDEKPSHLLQRIRNLASGQCNESVL